MSPGNDDKIDILKAAAAAEALGALDVGQGAVSVGGRIVALEGAEGTDGMLERVASLRGAGRISPRRRGVLVKLCKPQQDVRADLPSIGLSTVNECQGGGLGGNCNRGGTCSRAGSPGCDQGSRRSRAFCLRARSRPAVMGAVMKIAIVAGEVSGDLLGADLVAALKRRHAGIELVGVGGDALEAQGLKSLFDFSELSIMGVTQVLGKLPKLVARIRQTTAAIIAAKPDILIVIDSPDFTHRVAKRVREALPELPVVNYVCPSVWAWKEYRAQQMLGYVDHVLAVLPFEPAVMEQLGGPQTTYVGHRLTADADLIAARRGRAEKPKTAGEGRKTIMLLPGSRSSEITKLLPYFRDAVNELVARDGTMRFLMPTVSRQGIDGSQPREGLGNETGDPDWQ